MQKSKIHDKSQVRKEVRVSKKISDTLLYDNKRGPLGIIEIKDEGTKPYSTKMQARGIGGIKKRQEKSNENIDEMSQGLMQKISEGVCCLS